MTRATRSCFFANGILGSRLIYSRNTQQGVPALSSLPRVGDEELFITNPMPLTISAITSLFAGPYKDARTSPLREYWHQAKPKSFAPSVSPLQFAHPSHRAQAAPPPSSQDQT